MSQPSAGDVSIEVRALAQVLDSLSYYQVLGVEPEAPLDQVRAAFVRRSRVFDPDRQRGGTPEDRRQLVSLQARINEAYQVLSDERRRAAYDRGLESGTLRLSGGRVAAPMGPGVGAAAVRARVGPGRRIHRCRLRSGSSRWGSRASGAATRTRRSCTTRWRCSSNLPPRHCARRWRGWVPRSGARPGTAGPASGAATAGPASGAATAGPASGAATAGPASDPAVIGSERRHERHPYPRPVRLRLATWQQFETLHARDISSGGMFVRTSAAFTVGARLELKLVLPDRREVSLGAEVVHVISAAREVAGAMPGIGVRFLPMDEAAGAALEEIVAHARAQVPILRAEDLFSGI